MATAYVTADYTRAVDRLILSNVDIVASSLAYGGGIDCPGTSAGSVAVNNFSRVYGGLWIQAAGNSGHAGTSCTLRDPAGATYAFAVGGILDSAAIQAGNAGTVQGGPIYTNSSRGNIPFHSGVRSVIATTAVSGQTLLPDGMPNTYAWIGLGTSYAQPVVAGAAIDLRDFWIVNGPGAGYGAAFINNPGFSIVQLLLMGDRESESGANLTTGYDSLFGNGRFRARLFTTSGMDDPWATRVASLNVNNGQTTTYNIWGGQQFPAGVDRLIVTAWWAEPDYVNGADITIEVRTTCGAAFSRSDLSWDNKKRVFINDAGVVAGRCWAVDVTAHSAPANPWDGNQARRTVFIGWYYEDEARDDLSSDIW